MKKLLTSLLLSIFSLCVVEGQTKPTVSAGNDTTIYLPSNSCSLVGMATAASGKKISTWSWSKVGKYLGYIQYPNKQITTMQGLVQGVYKVQIKVTQNNRVTNSAYKTITVTTQNCPTPNTPRVLTITPTASGEIYRPNVSGWRAGDTLLVPSGTYTVNEFVGLVANRCQHITIMMAGIVHLNGRFNLTMLDSFIDVDGRIYGTNTIGLFVKGVVGCTESSYITFNYIDITNPYIDSTHRGGVGMFFKENPDSTRPVTYYPNYTMTKIGIYHCRIHNTSGEGMYIGHTDPDGIDFIHPPTNMDSVEIAYNTTDSTGWDGIQLSNGQYGCSIHDNTVTHFGLQNLNPQQAGIIFGGNCQGNVYNNTVRNGTGNTVQVFGFGTINVFNNEIDSGGNDLTTNGQNQFFSNQYNLTVYPSTHNQQINIYNNNFKSLVKNAVVKVQNDGGNASGATATNNHICAPNLIFSAIILDPSGSSQSGNTLSCP